MFEPPKEARMSEWTGSVLLREVEARIELPFVTAFGEPSAFARIVLNGVESRGRTTILLVGPPDGMATIVGQTVHRSIQKSANKIPITH
jgi:hypothetical protein